MLSNKTPNRLSNQASPYLLQHAYNPVDWWPWCGEAFAKAKSEDKPVFLSVGYSTCHWCHVMAHESFEDDKVADFLNKHFICVKVDKEERPDIDSVYMRACMALTASGGWPLSVFMDHSGKPFFAGTYFPKRRRFGSIGFMELLETIRESWENDREELMRSAESIAAHMRAENRPRGRYAEDSLCERAVLTFRSTFDATYGGFGQAPKFPNPHNLLFLMEMSKHTGDKSCMDMAEATLLGMAKGGIFDHVGFGFSRYSTDEKWLAPHFEKMLYDNALLVMAYTKAYEHSGKAVYRTVAEKTIAYIQREMTDPGGGFYSAQDADSEGVEGKYYVFSPEETISVLGPDSAAAFNRIYDITERGNFEGGSIPNQIKNDSLDESMAPYLERLYQYRKNRMRLHKDDKILCAWNALMIAALCRAATVFACEAYLDAAHRAAGFIEENLAAGDSLLASFREGKRSGAGFLDDYAFYIYALLALYQATLEESYLARAVALTKKTITAFFDPEEGGFYVYGISGEQLLLRPKETYDGAIPSGNSIMAMNLVFLSLLSLDEFEAVLQQQLAFMDREASRYPAGYAFYLLATLKRSFPGQKVTAVLQSASERERVKKELLGEGFVRIMEAETDAYPLKDGKTTYYLCQGQTCLPATNAFPKQGKAIPVADKSQGERLIQENTQIEADQ